MIEVFPQDLRLNEVNSVFLEVNLALSLVKIEFHIGILIIPIRQFVKPLMIYLLWSNVAFSRGRACRPGLERYN
jgi:hypothetical protein